MTTPGRAVSVRDGELPPLVRPALRVAPLVRAWFWAVTAAEWLILRRHVAGARRWVGATALAWLVGLGVFLGFTMPLWQPGQPVSLIVVIGISGGLLMAATTSLITGLALRRLLR